MIVPLVQIYITLLPQVQNYEFAPVKIYNFAPGSNLQYCHYFSFWQITILPQSKNTTFPQLKITILPLF